MSRDAVIPRSLGMTAIRLPMPVLGILGVGAATSVAVYALWLHDPSVVEENHLVENSQAGLLVLAAMIHGWRGWTMDIAERRLRFGLALFCIALVLREVDVDRLGDEAIMSIVEPILRLTLVVVYVIWGWTSRDVLETLWSNRFPIAFSGVGWLVFAGCVLYGASWPFDRYPQQSGGDTAILFEETLQLLATMMLFLASLAPHVRALRAAPK
jgi:hypothetical protein